MSVGAKLFAYAMDGKHSTFAAMRYTLDEKIDVKMMDEALKISAKRFPYFQVKLFEKDKSLVWVKHDKEPRIYEDSKAYVINGRDNDDFLYRISVCDNQLTAYFFHGLTDGSGMGAFVGRILLEYYRLKGEEIKCNASYEWILEDMSLEETTLPESRFPVEEEGKKLNSEMGGECFFFPEKKSYLGKVYMFECDSAQIMEFARLNDGSPNSIAQILMAKAVNKLHPEAVNQGIDISVAVNGKNILGVSRSYPPFLQSCTFRFEKKSFEMDTEMLDTCVRGKTIVDSSDIVMIPKLKGMLKLDKAFSYMPSVDAKRILAKKCVERARCTASVSYAGRMSYGSIDRHIKSLYSFVDSVTPVLEINSINDRFYFSLTTCFDGEKYAQALCQCFEETGIKCSELQTLELSEGIGKIKKIKMGFNLATFQVICGISKMKRS